jgi:limonene-1,2-epoxide hydrolase
MKRRDWLLAAPAALAVTGATALGAVESARGVHFDRVKNVIMSWRRKDLAAVLEACADDIVWYSHVGSPPVVGKVAMQAFIERMAVQMQEVRWRIFHYAESGDTVFTEGVDDFTAPDGTRVAIPYAGLMRFRDGKVIEWRDYFDRASFDRYKAGEAPAEHVATLINQPALF